MSIAIIWSLLQRFWIPILVAGALAVVAGYHFAAIHKAVKKNDAEWQVKIKANSEAWIAKVREADDITHAKEQTFATTVTTINEARAKEKSDAKINLDNAVYLAKQRGMYDPYAAKGCAATGETKTPAPTGVGDDREERRLSDKFAEMLLAEAVRADDMVRESNAVKRLLGAAYKACSQ